MRRPLLIACLLTLAIAFLYAPVRNHAFVDFDDLVYVTENPSVKAGLSWAGVRFAFVENYANLWHPLTWLSLMAGVALHGAEKAGPFLVTNVALHILNTLLLLLAVRALCGRLLPAAIAAAVFGLHPLQVEAVAWVSARKEVLAGCFFLCTLLAYTRYARRGGWRAYALVMASLVLCLASKGSHASLPFLLLVLDYWPLERWRAESASARARIHELILEKLPLLAIAVAAVGLGLYFAAGLDNPWLTDPPLANRAAQGIVNIVETLGRFCWPSQLAITYPTPRQMGLSDWSAAHVAGAALFLAGVTLLAWRERTRRPYLLVGWLWFVGMLLPMVGLIPAGLRVMHDRYSYVPMIGLALVLGFGFEEWIRRLRAVSTVWLRAVPIAALAALLSLGAALTAKQVGFWRDSLTLFEHALAVNDRNAIIHAGRGTVLARGGDLAGARAAFEAALAIHPDYPAVNSSLGYLLFQQGQIDAAIPLLRRAVALRPDWPRGLVPLGNALLARGSIDEGLDTLRAAVRAAPDSSTTHYWLANGLYLAGQWQSARAEYEAALRIDPASPWARQGLDRLNASHPSGG